MASFSKTPNYQLLCAVELSSATKLKGSATLWATVATKRQQRAKQVGETCHPKTPPRLGLLQTVGKCVLSCLVEPGVDERDREGKHRIVRDMARVITFTSSLPLQRATNQLSVKPTPWRLPLGPVNKKAKHGRPTQESCRRLCDRFALNMWLPPKDNCLPADAQEDQEQRWRRHLSSSPLALLAGLLRLVRLLLVVLLVRH